SAARGHIAAAARCPPELVPVETRRRSTSRYRRSPGRHRSRHRHRPLPGFLRARPQHPDNANLEAELRQSRHSAAPLPLAETFLGPAAASGPASAATRPSRALSRRGRRRASGGRRSATAG
ncbi:unnamed protein product, partial [Ectocarpus sp. 8 AP-2014]